MFLKKIIQSLASFFLITLLLFALVRSLPGDTAQMMLGEKANEASLAQVRQDLGLDQPLWMQYGLYMKKLLVDFDFGESTMAKEPVWEMICEKIPATCELGFLSIFFAVIFGLTLGVWSSQKQTPFRNTIALIFSSVGVSVPVFWIGLFLSLFFGLELDWLPISGRVGIEFDYSPITGFLLFDSLIIHQDFELFVDGLQHIILPALTLSILPLAYVVKMTRSAIFETRSEDYVRTARAKGVREIGVFYKHIFRNAAIPVVTLIGLQIGSLVGGAVMTESVFSWPGVGTWILSSVSGRDLPALEGAVLVICLMVMLINLLTDLTCRVLDPRIT